MRADPAALLRRLVSSPWQMAGLALLLGIALVWSTPFLWMLVAAFRPDAAGGIGMASLVPTGAPSIANFVEAWEQATFPLYYLNTAIVVIGILSVQLVTITLSGYAFARFEFRGRDTLFALFLLQLMLIPPVLIVPNLFVITRLGLYDTLLGVMAPYWASAFGTFLMRQTFRGIPREFEEAAIVDGAGFFQLLRHVLVPLARPALIAFAIVSVASHWNEFVWPLMVVNSPSNHVLTVGLATFTRGAEGAAAWGVIAAGTFLVAFPLLVVFAVFQRQFVSSFMFSGIK